MLTAKIPSMYSIETVSFSFTVLVSAKARNCLAKITVCSFISCQSALDRSQLEQYCGPKNYLILYHSVLMYFAE